MAEAVGLTRPKEDAHNVVYLLDSDEKGAKDKDDKKRRCATVRAIKGSSHRKVNVQVSNPAPVMFEYEF